jgi:hypothetical protein
MSAPTEWTCTYCTFGPMNCSEQTCLICNKPRLPNQCVAQGVLPPLHPAPTGQNVSRGIAVGRTARLGGRRNKRKNKSRKNKKSLRRR